MRRYFVFLTIAFFVLTFVGSAVGAHIPGVLFSDPLAYNDGFGMDPVDGNPFWRGSVSYYGYPVIPIPPFSVTDDAIVANVDYAVYAPTQFEASFGEVPGVGNTDWVYAYQIFNYAPNPQNDISSFTVGLDGDENPIFIGFLDGSGNNPTEAIFSEPAPPGSAKWTIMVGNSGEVSDILFFTAPGSPETHQSSLLQAGFGVGEDLPSPIPEPAILSMMLLAVVSLGLWRVRRVSQI